MWQHHHHHEEKWSKSLRQWGSHSGLIQIPSWHEHFGESGASDTNKHPTPPFCSLTVMDINGWEEIFLIANQTRMLLMSICSLCASGWRSTLKHTKNHVLDWDTSHFQSQINPKHASKGSSDPKWTSKVLKSRITSNTKKRSDESRSGQSQDSQNTLAINDQNKKRVLLPQRNSKVVFTE